MSKEYLDQQEAALTTGKRFENAFASIKTANNSVVDAVLPTKATNPDNVKRVERLVDAAKWDFLFPKRTASYTYTNFLRAVAKFAGLCMTYTGTRAARSDSICAKSLASMFAHFTQETGMHSPALATPEWRQGLYYVREVGCKTGSGCGYNGECGQSGTWQLEDWPCGKDPNTGAWHKYYGRGAKQLSYHYNYGPFSDFIFGDATVLLNDPDRVAETWLNLASAVFFFVFPQPPKPSMLHVIDETWQPTASDIAGKRTRGFGVTTMIINGGIECNVGMEKAQSVNRIKYYRGHADALGVPIAQDEQLTCGDMKPFVKPPGKTDFALHWENDWTYHASKPFSGQSFACRLEGGYQTQFSTLKKGDYARCVSKSYGVEICGASPGGEAATAAPAAPAGGTPTTASQTQAPAATASSSSSSSATAQSPTSTATVGAPEASSSGPDATNAAKAFVDAVASTPYTFMKLKTTATASCDIESASSCMEPSNEYHWKDMVSALRSMVDRGIAGRKFFVGGDVRYGLANLAAFLAQTMQETIQYDACDENNWSDAAAVAMTEKGGGTAGSVYPASAACGQLGQSYEDYKCADST